MRIGWLSNPFGLDLQALSMKISQTNAANKFKCLQADCPDTCCKGWSMQLDDITFEKYKGAGLENAVAYDGDIRVMKRDEKTDFCVKFEGGICAIHKDKGAGFLGDACNFYPRVVRKMGDETLMTLTPSCPEVVRLMLEEPNMAMLIASEAERLPHMMKDWLPVDVNAADAIMIHERFLAECNAAASPEQILARIYSVSNSLELLEKKDWAGAVDFMFRVADGKLLPPEINMMDDYNILQVFLGLMHATGKKRSERLELVLASIAKYLGVEINFETLLMQEVSEPTKPNDVGDVILKRYLAAQLTFNTYPFAGMGMNMKERAKVLIFKFCLIRLALCAWEGNAVDAIQPLSRIIDHLADATLVLKLMDSFGWNSEPRILGLINS